MNLSETSSDLSPAALFGSLPVLKIGFDVHIPHRSRLPRYLGSTWRGMIGWELQRLICPFHHKPECKSCSIQDHCPYYMLFEKETVLSGIRDAPRGYILYPPICPEADQVLEITLIGQCARCLPVVMTGVIEGGARGLGSERVRYDINELWEYLPGGHRRALSSGADAISDASGPFPLSDWLDERHYDVCQPDAFQAFFLTPLRLRKHGRYMDQMNWPFFFSTIACRLEAMNCLFHTGAALGKETYLQLRPCFEAMSEFSAQLKWIDYSRFSNRQQRKLLMGGLVGDVCALEPLPDNLRCWWRAASLLHVGKGASMGLGKIALSE